MLFICSFYPYVYPYFYPIIVLGAKYVVVVEGINKDTDLFAKTDSLVDSFVIFSSFCYKQTLALVSTSGRVLICKAVLLLHQLNHFSTAEKLASSISSASFIYSQSASLFGLKHMKNNCYMGLALNRSPQHYKTNKQKATKTRK